MGVPGLTTPTLSVDELDKKINDLKAVEAWLNLNMSMLRGSIQALEVQRNTIATLKSVGASLAAAVNQNTAQAPAPGADHKSIFDANPYTSAFFQHAREADKQKPAAAQPAPPPPAPEPKAAAAAPAPDQAKPQADPTAGAAALWWNLLQDQFKQAVSTAAASESMMAETAAKFAAAATAKPPTEATPPATEAPEPAPDKKPAAKRAAPKPVKPASGK